jgi:thiol:disulfide interchange protein DsbD
MKNRIILLFAFLSLTISSNIQAQLITPVRWTFSQKQISATEIDLIADAQISPKWHLYGMYFASGGPNPTVITITPPKGIELLGKATQSPKPHEAMDDVFGIVIQTFDNKARFTQRIKVSTTTDTKINFEIEGQACLDDGQCVLTSDQHSFLIKGIKTSEIPQQQKAETTLQPADSTLNANNSNDSVTTDSAAIHADTLPNSPEISTQIPTNEPAYDSLWSLFLLAFGAGLLALVTPCVFPMIPMTVSFFMKDKTNLRKSRFEASVFSISIIAIYTIIGTAVAVTLGADFANWLSTHWLPNTFFFLIFMFFAASFLGMFEIVLPSWLVNKMDQKADKGGITGAFFMAFTLVLVSFSCTGPIVGTILVKSATGNFLEPIVGMFGFSLAFALPFGFFAFFHEILERNRLKSGAWLNSVKVILGLLEIALGLKFLSIADQTYHWGILDREIYLALWIVIFAIMGFYLIGKLKFAHDSDLPHITVPRLGLAIITFSFVVYLIPGMWGAPLKALAGYLPPQTSLDFDLSATTEGQSLQNAKTQLCEKPKYAEYFHKMPHGLEAYYDIDQALACARKQDKPIFIDFTGHGCVNCREMEARVWSDPRVLQRLRDNFIILTLYVDDKTELPQAQWQTTTDGKTLKTIGKINAHYQIAQYGINAQPYYITLDNQAQQLVKPQAYDLNAANFVAFLDNAQSEYNKRKK